MKQQNYLFLDFSFSDFKTINNLETKLESEQH